MRPCEYSSEQHQTTANTDGASLQSAAVYKRNLRAANKSARTQCARQLNASKTQVERRACVHTLNAHTLHCGSARGPTSHRFMFSPFRKKNVGKILVTYLRCVATLSFGSFSARLPQLASHINIGNSFIFEKLNFCLPTLL